MIRKISWGLMMAVVLATGCKTPSEPVMVKFIGETQGTYYAVTYFCSDTVNLQPQVDSLLKRFDSTASAYKPNSILSRINKNDITATVDSDFKAIFHKARKVSEQTNGAFDITVGNLVNAWGFGYTDRMKVDKKVVDSLMEFVGYRGVRLQGEKIIKEDSRIVIDFNAIAQGYAVDLLADFLEKRGIKSFLVDIGGEVVARGTKPDGELWNVGIEEPAKNAEDARSVNSIVHLRNMALSTSGNYRKYYEENGVRYSHTIDPSTGYPVTHSLLSVSVLASDCATADAYATAFMVLGLGKSKEFLEQHKELDAFFIYFQNDSTKTYFTEGFRKILE